MLTSINNLANYKKNNNYIYLIFFSSYILHIIASYYSVGYYSLDEHFQILEPLGYKLHLRWGISSIWEFNEDIRLRPWSQIYFYYLLTKLLIFIGINDPFIWAFFLRLVSSSIGFVSLLFLYKFFQKEINFKKYSIIIFFLFWFYPIIHARTSSENLSISFFIIGVTSLLNLLNNFKDENLRNKHIKILIYSVIIGVSLVFRYNLGFFAIPLFLWILYKYKSILISLLFSFGVLISLSIGLILDFFGYNNLFTLTYYRYFYFNIVSKAFERFGVDPWYYYLIEILNNFSPPISIIIIFSSLFFWIKNPKHVFTWITAFYFFIFCYLSHKELRFIFPVLYFAPIFCIYLFEYFRKFYVINILKYFFIVINFIFLILIFLPANREIHLLNFISKNINKNENLYYLDDENPYYADGLPLYFYTFNMVQINKIENIDSVENKIILLDNAWIVTKDYKKFKILTDEYNCKKQYSTYPVNLIEMNKNWRNRKLNWYVVNCQ